jgi:hypothetical protein
MAAQQTPTPNQQQKSQQTQNRTQAQRIAQLVRAGLMKTSELPALKVAMARHAKVGDVAKLPRNQRDVLNRYYQSTAAAALGSQQSTAAVRRNLMNGYEISRDDYITEATFNDPPMILVLKRRGVRIFPDGKRVALYQNEKLGMSFTVPYSSAGPEKELVGVSEDVEDVMESLEQVAKYAQQDNVTSHAKHFKFADGSKLKVSHGAAKAIHMVHGALNPENQQKFAEMLKDPKRFTKAAHFALSKVNFTIGGK